MSQYRSVIGVNCRACGAPTCKNCRVYAPTRIDDLCRSCSDEWAAEEKEAGDMARGSGQDG